MLQKNQLFRRMQQRNLFRTFSRGYSRPCLSSQRQPPHNHHVPYQSATPHSQTHHSIPTRYDSVKTATVQLSSSRTQKQSTPNMALKKNSFNQYRTNNFNHLRTLPMQSKHKINSEAETQNYLHAPINQKQFINSSGFPRPDLTYKQDRFKLRSCLDKRGVNYESIEDEAEFSLLEAKRRTIANKNSSGTVNSHTILLGQQNVTERILPINHPKFSRLLSDMLKQKRQKNSIMN